MHTVRSSRHALAGDGRALEFCCSERVTGEVLLRDEKPRDICDQHEAMLAAIAAGDAGSAEAPARSHVSQAASFMTARLRAWTGPARR